MLWLKCAILVSFVLVGGVLLLAEDDDGAANRPMSVMLPNGASVPISSAFPIITWRKLDGYQLLKGSSAEHDVFFFATIFNEKETEAAQLAKLLRLMFGVEISALDPVEESPRQANQQTEIFRMRSETQYDGYLLGFVRSRSRKEAVVFCIIGPENQFYETSKAFWDMLGRYKPGLATAEDDRGVDSWMVMAAIAIFFLNTGLLWYGFHLMAVARAIEIEESA